MTQIKEIFKEVSFISIHNKGECRGFWMVKFLLSQTDLAAESVNDVIVDQEHTDRKSLKKSIGFKFHQFIEFLKSNILF